MAYDFQSRPVGHHRSQGSDFTSLRFKDLVSYHEQGRVILNSRMFYKDHRHSSKCLSLTDFIMRYLPNFSRRNTKFSTRVESFFKHHFLVSSLQDSRSLLTKKQGVNHSGLCLFLWKNCPTILVWYPILWKDGPATPVCSPFCGKIVQPPWFDRFSMERASNHSGLLTRAMERVPNHSG